MKRFQDCCKEVIWSKISIEENCAVPGYEEIIGRKLEECHLVVPAIDSNSVMFTIIADVLNSPSGRFQRTLLVEITALVT
jgi:hypothetical protein